MHDQPTPSPDDDRLRDEEADDAFPRIASLRQIAEHYGPNVSAILRNDDFPTEPSSYFVQSQTVTSRGRRPGSRTPSTPCAREPSVTPA